MPVVSKILANENYIDITQRENIMHSLPYGIARYSNKGNTIYLAKIEQVTYAAVVEFIKWYNNQSK
jgi:hypothetical protein